MAVTFTKEASTADAGIAKSILGFEVVAGLLNIGDSYATNGIAVAATDFISGTSLTLDSLICEDSQVGTWFYRWDKGNGKVESYTAVGSTVTETSAAVDLSAATASFRVIAFLS